MGYTEDEPNIYDIQFLLWDSTLDDEYSETLVNPDNEALACAARTVYAYFMELFDCYLTSGRFRESTFSEALDYQTDLCRGNRQVAQSAAEASIAFRYQVGPLALKPQEWLSALLTVHGHADKAAAVAAIVAKDLEPYCWSVTTARPSPCAVSMTNS